MSNSLYGVSATSASDAWAVGYYDISTNQDRSLVLHWDGSAWTQVPSPNPATLTNELYGVSAISANDVWAVGDYTNNTTSAIKSRQPRAPAGLAAAAGLAGFRPGYRWPGPPERRLRSRLWSASGAG